MIQWRGLVGDARSVLVLGAHADDIEIGCAASLRHLIAAARPLSLHWVVLSAEGERAEEARVSANRLADGCELSVEVLSFRERYFPYLPELKEWFDQLGHRIRPGLVVCPWTDDAHQDHATAARLAHQTFRSGTILEYEIPKRDGDIGRPSVYVSLSGEDMEWKADHLMRAFPSQKERDWFDRRTFRALGRLRGVEAGTEWAEAFHCSRIMIE